MAGITVCVHLLIGTYINSTLHVYMHGICTIVGLLSRAFDISFFLYVNCAAVLLDSALHCCGSLDTASISAHVLVHVQYFILQWWSLSNICYS